MRLDGQQLIHMAAKHQRAIPPRALRPEVPVIALGVLSTIQSFGCKSTPGQVHCRTTSERAASRRARLRDEYKRSAVAPGEIALHFLIAGACGRHCQALRETYMPLPRPKELQAARREAAREGDMIFLNTTEDQLGGCSYKYLLWMELALAYYPHAGFIAFADDDEYIHYRNLFAELFRTPFSYFRTCSFPNLSKA